MRGVQLASRSETPHSGLAKKSFTFPFKTQGFSPVISHLSQASDKMFVDCNLCAFQITLAQLLGKVRLRFPHRTVDCRLNVSALIGL
jgi:hypothetical protein